MNGEIICVGTELLLGNIVNTNARFLAEEMASLGINVYNQSVVGDNEGRIKQELGVALRRSQIVILTGGLGPTEDDITKESVASFFSLNLTEDEDSRRRIDKYFKRTGRIAVKSNYKQALVPKGAHIFPNDIGTAPGCAVEYNENTVIILPGPPAEMEAMFLNYVKPYLLSKTRETIVSHNIRIFGEMESSVEEKIAQYTKFQNPTLATYASEGEVSLRVTAKAHNRIMADNLCLPIINTVCDTLGDCVYGVDSGEIQSVVVEMLREKGLKVATAESCTAGLLSAMITEVPGASEIFDLGVSAYANQIKTGALGVPESVIEKYGAVSEHTAAYMAIGVRKVANADLGIGITGVAGPAASESKPVGLVYIALADKNNIWIRRATFGHGTNERDKIRRSSAKTALDLLRRYLCSLPLVMEGGFATGSIPVAMDTQPAIAKAAEKPVKIIEKKPVTTSQSTFSDKELADMINAVAQIDEHEQLSKEEVEAYRQTQSGYIAFTDYDDNYENGKKRRLFKRKRGYEDTPVDSAGMITSSDEDPNEPITTEDGKTIYLSKKAYFMKFLSTLIPWKGDAVKDIIRKTLFLIAILTLIVSSVYIVDYFYEQNKQTTVIEEIRESYSLVKSSTEKNQDGQYQSFNNLLSQNSETKAWIYIPGTEVDNPVVLHDDNDFYLEHNFLKEKSRYGTLFFDSQSTILSYGISQNLIIYGHNMNDGSMFGTLKRYKNVNFYKENPIIKLKTLYDDSKYKIFAIMITGATPEQSGDYTFDYRTTAFASQNDFLEWIQQVKSRSIINTGIDVQAEDRIITLSTCTGEFDDARLVIMARRVRTGEYSDIDETLVSVNSSPRYPQAYYDKKGIENPYAESSADVALGTDSSSSDQNVSSGEPDSWFDEQPAAYASSTFENDITYEEGTVSELYPQTDSSASVTDTTSVTDTLSMVDTSSITDTISIDTNEENFGVLQSDTFE